MFSSSAAAVAAGFVPAVAAAEEELSFLRAWHYQLDP